MYIVANNHKSAKASLTVIRHSHESTTHNNVNVMAGRRYTPTDVGIKSTPSRHVI